MSLSVSEAFSELLTRIAPSSVEVDARSRHRTSIDQAMRAEFGGFNRILVFGSHTRDTAIKYHSDVDYLALLGINDVTHGGRRVNSTTTLARLKRTLEVRFPNTRIRVDGPAVVVHFSQGEGAVDVVPGIYVGMTDVSPKRPIYEIPDGTGWWRRTSPQLHADILITAANEVRARGKLTRTTKLLKHWKYARNPKIPLFGFHLETLLAYFDVCTGVKGYQICVHDALCLLRDRRGQALNDPLGFAGRLDAVTTDAQRSELADAARYGAEKAASAIHAEFAGEIDDAFYYWKLVFNQQFPSRY